MSDFDTMAQMQFADVARKRQKEDRSPRVIVVDPYANKITEKRFNNVFRLVDFVYKPHQCIDWNSLLPKAQSN
jgi:hypothetical protein